MTVEEIIEAARQLSEDDRHKVLHAMFESLGTRTVSADGKSSSISIGQSHVASGGGQSQSTSESRSYGTSTNINRGFTTRPPVDDKN